MNRRPLAVFALAVTALGFTGCSSLAEEYDKAGDAATAAAVEQDMKRGKAEYLIERSEQDQIPVVDFNHEARQGDALSAGPGFTAFAVRMPDGTYRWCIAQQLGGIHLGPVMPGCSTAPDHWVLPVDAQVFDFVEEARSGSPFDGRAGINAYVTRLPDDTYLWSISYRTEGMYHDAQGYSEPAPVDWKP